MAQRPIFLPQSVGRPLIKSCSIAFQWHPGFAVSQKKKNIQALHDGARLLGFQEVLEVSTKSQGENGQKLSAFNLPIRVNDNETTVECAFQGSKVFSDGGPYYDLYEVGSSAAKRDPRIRNSGALTSFEFNGEDFPLEPKTAFYDWLYFNALYQNKELSLELLKFDGFSDIEFNPKRSINCQAKSCALYSALLQRELVDDALESFGAFLNIVECA